jgi:ubiquinol-cytochrome c reductase cytochrome b subunit
MGILEGALRMMPAWEYSRLGHTLSLGVLIPFALPLTIILGGATFWPFFEQWATGDKSWHNINDRPRNAPVRTGVGMATVVFYGILWLEGANDVIADKLQIPLYTITWISRIAIIIVPPLTFFATRRICLGLQRKDRELLEHGLETGVIRQMPDGEFIEVHRPVSEDTRAVLEAKRAPELLPAPGAEDENGVPAPASLGLMGWAKGVSNRAFAETIVAGNGHGNGHGPNGHGADGHEVAAVGAGEGAGLSGLSGPSGHGEGHAIESGSSGASGSSEGSGGAAALAPGDEDES